MPIKNKIYKLLRKSERYTKTDMVYLAKGGFWLTLGQVVSSLAAFLLAIAFANLLPKETYGTYKYILSLIGLLAIPTLSGMGTAVTRAVAQGYDGSFIPALKLKIKWGLLGGLASIGLASYYYLNSNIELTIAFLITAIFIPLMDTFSLYGALLQGKKEFGIATRYGIWIKIIAATSIFITLYFTKNLFAILFIYLASYTLLRLIFLKLSLKFIANKKQDPDTISYGKHLSLMGIISLTATQIDKLLIWHFIGAAELAIYTIAVAMPEQIKGVFKNISNLALPKFAKKTSTEIKTHINKKLWKFFIALSLVTIIYWFVSPIIFKIFFPNYLESIFYSQIFILSLPFAVLIWPLYTLLESQKFTKKLYLYQFISSIIQIILTIFFIIYLNLIGVIIARMLSRLINFIILTIISRKDN